MNKLYNRIISIFVEKVFDCGALPAVGIGIKKLRNPP